MIRLSRYRVAFLAGFLIIPGVLWSIQAGPTLAKRKEYLHRQENALSVQQKNSRLPGERDALAAEWESFQPIADKALGNLANDLNPHLVQKRIHGIALELGCELKIKPMPFLDGDFAVRFQINGEGSYPALVQLIDQLEQGQHFVRFEKLSLVMPTGTYSDASTGAVRIVGVLLIPPMPDGVEDLGQVHEQGNGVGGGR